MPKKKLYPVDTGRSDSGSVVGVLIAIVLLAVIALGAVGIDIAHNITTRTAEQSATDAAALAGAAYIVQNPTGGADAPATVIAADQTTSFNQSAGSQTTANNVCANNTADGKAVLNGSHGCTVTATPIAASTTTVASAPFPGNNGECNVVASMPINNFFAAMFGRKTDTVPAVSVATGYATVVGVDPNQLFPIAVSLDTQTGHSTNAADNNLPLNMCQIGTQTAFTLQEPCANAAWTTFNALKTPSAYPSETTQLNWINQALGPYTGSFTTGINVPAQLVGEKNSQGTQPTGSAMTTSSYQAGGIDLWGDLSLPANISGNLPMTVNLPVMAGSQPFRQTTNNAGTAVAGTQSTPYGPSTHPLLGFIGFKITKAVYGPDPSTGQSELQYIEGTVVKTLVKGTPGIANPQSFPVGQTVPKNPQGAVTVAAWNSVLDLALQNLSPGLVMLGATNLNVSPAQQPAGSTGVGPAGLIPAANTDTYFATTDKTGTTAYEDVSKSPLAGTQVATTLGSSYTTDIGSPPTPETYTAGENLASVPRVEPNLGGIAGSGVVYATAQVLPNTPATITMYFTDETGLNKIGGVTEWTSNGVTNLGTNGITYNVTPPSPSPGVTAPPVPVGWNLPPGFGLDGYLSQVVINVPASALSSPVVLQVDSADDDRVGDTGMTLIQLNFPNCPLPVN